MAQADVAAFQLRRVNPFPGLMIDAAIWRDAHDYHRNQMRLHHLALHGWGIVQGLDVRLRGADNTLVVEPGVAIDPAGRSIVVTQQYVHRMEAREPRVAYLVLQFSEVPSGPTQPAGDGLGQPTRLLEAYRIQQRDQLPDEPCLELARIQLDPARGPIAAPHDPDNPGPNELDVRFRVTVGAPTAAPVILPIAPSVEVPPPPPPPVVVATTPVPAPPIGAPAPVPPVAAPGRSATPLSTLTLALAAHKGEGWDRHRDGLRFLAREVEAASGRPTQAVGALSLGEAEGVDLLYVVGSAGLGLGSNEIAGIARVLEQGGIVVGEGCADTPRGEVGAREFAFSFAELAHRLGRRLARVERDHPLLVARHVFAAAPAGGRESARVLEAGGMIYCDADYGCAWQGGARERPLPRGAIRDALEFGVNLALYRGERR